MGAFPLWLGVVFFLSAFAFSFFRYRRLKGEAPEPAFEAMFIGIAVLCLIIGFFSSAISAWLSFLLFVSAGVGFVLYIHRYPPYTGDVDFDWLTEDASHIAPFQLHDDPFPARVRTSTMVGQGEYRRAVEFTSPVPRHDYRLRIESPEWSERPGASRSVRRIVIPGFPYRVWTNDVNFARDALEQSLRDRIRALDEYHSGSFMLDLQPGQLMIRGAHRPGEDAHVTEFQTLGYRVAQAIRQATERKEETVSLSEFEVPEGDIRCEICATAITGDAVQCTKCRTPHHAECWNWSRVCSTYACGGKRAVRITTGDSGPDIEFLKTIDPHPEVHCEVCGSDIENDVVHCARCRTPHHRACWEYMKVCSTYACGGRRALGQFTPDEVVLVEPDRKRRRRGPREAHARTEIPPEHRVPTPDSFQGNTFTMRRPFDARFRLGTSLQNGQRGTYSEFTCALTEDAHRVEIQEDPPGTALRVNSTNPAYADLLLSQGAKALVRRLAEMHDGRFRLLVEPGMLFAQSEGDFTGDFDLSDYSRLAYRVARKFR